MNDAAMDVCVRVLMCTHVFISLEFMPRSGTAGLNGNSKFNFLRNCQTVFQSRYSILYSHRQCIRVPISPQHHQHLLSVILITAILMGVKQYLVVLIYISLVTNDVVHLSMCLLVIYISSLEKCLFGYFAHFKNWIICLFIIEL